MSSGGMQNVYKELYKFKVFVLCTSDYPSIHPTTLLLLQSLALPTHINAMFKIQHHGHFLILKRIYKKQNLKESSCNSFVLKCSIFE